MAEDLNVPGHNSKSNVALKSINAMIRAPVKAMILKSIDRGFNSRMFSSCGLERLGIFNLFVDGRALPFSGEINLFECFREFFLVVGGVEPFIKTAFSKIRESLPCFFNDGNSDLIIGFFSHHTGTEDETLVVTIGFETGGIPLFQVL